MNESQKSEPQSDATIASHDTGASETSDKTARDVPKNPPDAPDADVHFASAETAEAARRAKTPWWDRRREKIREEIERNRRGEYVVPTWVLTVLLLAIIAGWAALIFFA